MALPLPRATITPSNASYLSYKNSPVRPVYVHAALPARWLRCHTDAYGGSTVLNSLISMNSKGCATALLPSSQTKDGGKTIRELQAAIAPLQRTVDATASDISRADQGLFQFVKYQGLGNDFLLVDNRHSTVPVISPKQAISVCDRNFGVGGDGVIFVLPGVYGSDYSMRIFNSDGSEPEMCGNGIRCMARFIAGELEGTTELRSYKIHTLAGIIIPQLQDNGQVSVDMGPPTLHAAKIPTKLAPSKDDAVVQVPLVVDQGIWSVTCVSMGNPHCITFVEDIKAVPLAQIGPIFEHHEAFPARTNTEFVEVVSSSHLQVLVWERGAGATLACGTGACAVVVAAVLEGRAERKCLVELPGGPLEIEWRIDNNHVYMTGPAKAVFKGTTFLQE